MDYASNGNLIDLDGSSLAGWDDLDTGAGASTANEAYQGETCLKLDSGDAGDLAQRRKDIGSYEGGNHIVVEVKVWHAALGTRPDTDHMRIEVQRSDARLQIAWETRGLYIQKAGGVFGEVGTDLVKYDGSAEWQTWVFDADFTTPSSATCDVYLNDVFQATVDCDYEVASTDGLTYITQRGSTTANRLTYFDYLKVGDMLVDTLSVSDSIVVTEAAYVNTLVVVTKNESVVITESVVAAVSDLQSSVSESVVVIESIAPLRVPYLSLNESLVVAMQLNQLALTQYSNYNFNSGCEFQGEYLAANSDGIFKLDDGDLDNTTEIDAFAELVMTDLGVVNQKRLRFVYVGYEADGGMRLLIKNDEGNERTYDLVPLGASDAQGSGRLSVGRDGKGRYWSFRIENTNGCDFSLDHIEVVPIVLVRKPEGAIDLSVSVSGGIGISESIGLSGL